MFLPLSERAADTHLALQQYRVWADVATLCMQPVDVATEVRLAAEDMLVFAAAKAAGARRRDGSERQEAQREVDAAARVCLHSMARRRSN